VHPDAFAVHGLNDAFLSDKPRFAEVADELLGFIADDPLVIHNASFDIGFLNAEFRRIERGAINPDRVVDTLAIARRRHPGAQNSLDALCARYRIDNSRRKKHGALLDAEILAEVYAELTGGKQSDLALLRADQTPGHDAALARAAARHADVPRIVLLGEDERQLHRSFVAEMGEKAIWNRYFQVESPAAAEPEPR
jgi:DNA polymerase-3 subunit epsilon